MWRSSEGLRDLAATTGSGLRPGVRRYVLALDRPGGAVPEGVGATARRRSPRVLERGARVSRDGDPLFADLQDVYDEIGEGLPPGRPSPARRTARRAAEIEASGLFTGVVVRQFDWEVSYDAEGYIRLLDTFSGHIAMEAWQRDRLYGAIRERLARRPGGRLRRHWGAALHVARRRDRPEPGRSAGRPPRPAGLSTRPAAAGRPARLLPTTRQPQLLAARRTGQPAPRSGQCRCWLATTLNHVIAGVGMPARAGPR